MAGEGRLFFYPFFQQLAGRLDLGDITKRVLGDEEEGAGVKVDVEEVDCFFESAKDFPFPELGAFFRFEQDAAVFQRQRKGILEGGRFFIDAERQDTAHGYPQEEPEDGEDEEGQGLYLFEEEEDGRKDGKNIDDYDEGSDLWSGEKVTT